MEYGIEAQDRGKFASGMAILAMLALLVLVFALQALPATDARPQGAHAPPVVELSVSLDLVPGTASANVTNSQDGVAMFGGNATVGKLQTSIQRVTVTLEGVPVPGWELIVSPETMVFTTDMPQAFFLSVKVPARTQVMSKTVTVTATATDGVQTATASTTATVAVAQFFKFSIGSDEPGVEGMRPGDSTAFEVTIYNEGNGRDTVQIDLVDSSHALEGYDFPRTVDLPPGQSVSITISVVTREDFDIGNDTAVVIRLIVTSTAAQKQGIAYAQPYSLTINFQTFLGNLAENWPAYLGWAVGFVVIIVVLVVVGRRFRRRRRLDSDVLASFSPKASR